MASSAVEQDDRSELWSRMSRVQVPSLTPSTPAGQQACGLATTVPATLGYRRDMTMSFAERSRLAELELVRVFDQDLDSFERMEAIDEAVARLADEGGRTQLLATIGLLHAAVDFHLSSVALSATETGTKVDDLLDSLISSLTPEGS
jgi:hypothetical protein